MKRKILRFTVLMLALALIGAEASFAYAAAGTDTQAGSGTQLSSKTQTSTEIVGGKESETGGEKAAADDKAKGQEQEQEQENQKNTDTENGISEEPISKLDISDFSVQLDKYMVIATGKPVTPQVISVSGEIKIKDKDTAEDESENITLSKAEYSVKYYKVESFENEIFDEVDEIAAVGEYKIVVTAKDTEKFEGEASCLFSVVGKAQHLTVSKTKYTLTVNSDAAVIKAHTDGDGSGFVFTSSDEDILKVSADGKVQIKKTGRAVVTVATVGDTLYQPAKVKLSFEISPARLRWDSKSMKKQKNQKTLVWKKQAGVTNYEIMYSTSKDFKQSVKLKGSGKTVKPETKTVLRKGSASRYTLKKLKKGNTYYVKMRAVTETVDSRGNERTLVGAWSTVRKINVQ